MLRFILAIAILLGAYFGVKYFIDNKPQPSQRPVLVRPTVVEIEPLAAEDFTALVTSSGVVRARTQSNIVAEVSGKIVSISDSFQPGAKFAAGSVLLTLEDSNHSNALAIASADLAASRASLAQLNTEAVNARSELSIARNNLRLGQQELARQKQLWQQRLITRSAFDAQQQQYNQLQQQVQTIQSRLNTFSARQAASQANIAGAEARKEREQLNLGRTKIVAPYAGRVLELRANVGQFVSPGTPLGVVYDDTAVEIELPLSLRELERLDLSEQSSNSQSASVILIDSVLQDEQWQGEVQRTAAALDPVSRQVKLIATIAPSADGGLPSIGQYLDAKIRGRVFRDVLVLPPAAVYQDRWILTREQGVTAVHPIELLWQDDQKVVVRGESNLAGKELIVTPLAGPLPGKVVVTAEQARAASRQKAKQRRDKKRSDAPSEDQ